MSVEVFGGLGGAEYWFASRVMEAEQTAVRRSQEMPWMERTGSMLSEMDLF